MSPERLFSVLNRPSFNHFNLFRPCFKLMHSYRPSLFVPKASLIKALFILTLTSAALLAVSTPAFAKISAYLPLKQDPQLEFHTNYILMAAKKANVKRPIAISQVKQAYNLVCATSQYASQRPRSLTNSCQYVANYLKISNKKTFVNHASIKAKAYDHKYLEAQQPLSAEANQRGELMASNLAVQGQYVYQPKDYFLVSLGGKSVDASSPSDVRLEDTFVSFGHEYAQFDIGYKAHWLSPFQNSAMLLSTHAPSFATVSLSNTKPISNWRFNYEFFVGELSTSDRIRYKGDYISGKPLLTGIHLSASPFSGFTLGFNRVMQSGGGDRGGLSFEEVLRAFFDPSGADNTSSSLSSDEQFGNQAASLTSRFDFNGGTPFSLYFEYGGEDTSRGSNFRLGNAVLSAGLDVPALFDVLHVNYEFSEWQLAWYGHSVYNDGLQNQGQLIGHWAAEQRQRYNSVAGNTVGAQHHNLTLGAQLNATNRLELNLTATQNEPLSSIDYKLGKSIQATWYTKWRRFNLAIMAQAHKNTLGEQHNGVSIQVNW